MFILYLQTYEYGNNHYIKNHVKHAVMLHAGCHANTRWFLAAVRNMIIYDYHGNHWIIRIYHEVQLWLKKCLTDLHLSEHLSEGFSG